MTKQELLNHLHAEASADPEQVPYLSVQNLPIWQLCAHSSVLGQLDGDSFVVDLNTKTNFGSLQVAEIEYSASLPNRPGLPPQIIFCQIGGPQRGWTQGLIAIQALRDLESEAKLTKPIKLILSTCRLGLSLYLESTAQTETAETSSSLDDFCQRQPDNMSLAKDLLKQSLINLLAR